MGHIFIWLGFVAQVISIALFVAAHGASGESRGYAGLFAVAFTLCAGVVIVPGTLFALVRAIGDAVRLRRKDGPAPRWFIFYVIMTLMPLILLGVAFWSGL